VDWSQAPLGRISFTDHYGGVPIDSPSWPGRPVEKQGVSSDLLRDLPVPVDIGKDQARLVAEVQRHAPFGTDPPDGMIVLDASALSLRGDQKDEDSDDRSGGTGLDHLTEQLEKTVIDSVKESAKRFVEFAFKKLAVVTANVVVSGAGHALEVGFEVLDAVQSAEASFSDPGALSIPVPCDATGLSLNVNVPLSEPSDGLAIVMAPESPSLTGGFAVEKAERSDDHRATPQATAERIEDNDAEPGIGRRTEDGVPRTELAGISEIQRDGVQVRPTRSGRRRRFGLCVVELDLDSLPLEGLPSVRAHTMREMAVAYLPELERFCLDEIDVLVYVDRKHGLGVWLWVTRQDDSAPDQHR
jgi:hypothetical protein